MADKIVIPATKRTEFGKGAARKARREDLIPAVVYGHGEDPIHVVLPGHQTHLAVRNPNALITLDIEGTEQMVIPKAIQRDIIKRSIDHMDLLTVRRGEKVVVDVYVEVTGEPAVGFEWILEQATVSVEAEATHLPEHVTVDITDRDENALPEHIELPKGVTLAMTDLESPVVSIHEPVEQDLGDEEETTEEEAAEGETAEGESEENAEGEES
ncbi:50S ribosomal protein L25/general stress protein Ctc [Nesterenkonia jeotgali]|uniref:Large ribosomal subunit protein bL25 n=1 Tax=Nesterenkonia jeotgali TaxID=317018 RepID=A0A0W8IK54_9MICC|nr:50S ribosomal protein L25/general stress protein Ctc [Nesterenkonia jeotgali]KUG60266.1 50S ribosomal protein L25 [Nesterenkonia jeotgali]MBA8920246.1 large subunit ribosomal protein L25 [Nesterenkonia jeotgali]